MSSPVTHAPVSHITRQCHLWEITRRDGLRLGFTDHDRNLEVEGRSFRAGSGLTAHALQQSTGLSVDNSEAVGLLSDAAIREEDLRSGRFDGAAVTIWRVDWQAPSLGQPLFRGSLGEISYSGGGFRAELRGLAEALNQPVGRVYGRNCAAVLADDRCRFSLGTFGYVTERAVEEVDAAGSVLSFAALEGFEDRWFEHGRLLALEGAAKGLSGMIKADRIGPEGRRIELWQSLRAPLRAGDVIRLTAGCDGTLGACRRKFSNVLNFQGFPFIPGEDWLTSYPRPDRPSSGGSLLGVLHG